MVDGLKAFTDTYYHAEFIPQWGYATTAHYQMDKKRQMTDELFECGALTGLGGYSVWGWVAVEGIPVLGGIGSAQDVRLLTGSRLGRRHADRVNVEPTEDNPLLKAIMDPEVDEESFLALLEENRSGKTEEWKRYRRSLSRLKLKKEDETEENVAMEA